jgi:HEAT repeat protein
MIKENQAEGRLHNQSAALSIYAKHFDYEAIPLLLKAVDNGNKELRYAVLNVAENLGGAAGTRAWIEKAASSVPETRAEIIDMLGRRGDRLAIDFITTSLNDSSPEVREEAIAALVKLQEKEAIPVLINHMAKGSDLDAAKSGLLQLLSQKHLAPVAAQLELSSGATKAAFIDLIAAKSGNSYFNDILELTSSQDAQERTAAFEALKNVSTEENLDPLIKLLHTVDGENEVQQVQQAITAAAKNQDSEKQKMENCYRHLKIQGKRKGL